MKNAFSLIFERNCETYSTVQLHTFAIAFMFTWTWSLSLKYDGIFSKFS